MCWVPHLQSQPAFKQSLVCAFPRPSARLGCRCLTACKFPPSKAGAELGSSLVEAAQVQSLKVLRNSEFSGQKVKVTN